MRDPGTIRRLTSLVRALADQTAAGTLTWRTRRNMVGEPSYTVSTPTATITVSSALLGIVSIKIQDQRGEVIEEYGGGGLTMKMGTSDLDRALQALQKELLKESDRVNSILDEVINELGGRVTD